ARTLQAATARLELRVAALAYGLVGGDGHGSRSPAHAAQLYGVGDDHRDQAHDDRDGGGVVVLLPGKGQVVGVQVRGEVRGDRVRCQALQDGRLVEELEAADDGEDRGDHDRSAD